jgi:hypothetical protein
MRTVRSLFMAAAVCKWHETDPRGVYENSLDELKKRMEAGNDCTSIADSPVVRLPGSFSKQPLEFGQVNHTVIPKVASLVLGQLRYAVLG